MAAHLLRLRVALLLGAFRGRWGATARTVAVIVVVAAATVVACVAVVSLRDASLEGARVVVVLGGSALTAGFALAPVIAGADDPLDPRRFAVFGLAERPLAGWLALAGLVSVPVAVVAAVGASTTVLWTRQGAPALVGAIGAVLAVVTCSLFARVFMALTATFLRERRSRELSGLFILAIIVVVVPTGVFLASLEWEGAVPSQLAAAVTVLGWTPLGAAWALPAAAAAGSPQVAANAVVAVVTVALLGLAWMWLVRRALSTVERPTIVRERSGLGWFAVAPGTPGGAIAARGIVYWFRDRRYIVNVVVVPVAAAIATVPPLLAGVPENLVTLIPVPIMALFFGWLPHNDVAYDSTAIWMHVAGGTRGVADRVGRLVPVVLIAVPLLAILIPVMTALHGRWAFLPAMTGVAVCLLLCGLGLSSISSALSPYPASQPGDSPFQQPQRAGGSGASAQAVVLFGALVLSAPVLWWAWIALTHDIRFARGALWGGIGIGVTVLIAGIALGSVAFERRGARLVEFAESM